MLEFPAGCFRVNGRLAVSRAIGDYGLKDVVIGEPDITCLTLNGNEDFLILACDGLWDYAGEDEVATKVYSALEKHNGKSMNFFLPVFLRFFRILVFLFGQTKKKKMVFICIFMKIDGIAK